MQPVRPVVLHQFVFEAVPASHVRKHTLNKTNNDSTRHSRQLNSRLASLATRPLNRARRVAAELCLAHAQNSQFIPGREIYLHTRRKIVLQKPKLDGALRVFQDTQHHDPRKRDLQSTFNRRDKAKNRGICSRRHFSVFFETTLLRKTSPSRT